MGKIFKLIADDALETMNKDYDECHVCGQLQVDLYPYQGSVKSKDETKEDIDIVCRDCIITKDLNRIEDWVFIPKIKVYVENLDLTENEKSDLTKRLCELYQRTPDIPMFMQQTDIPFCCADITEFIGTPNKVNELLDIDTCIYWKNKPDTDISWTDIKSLDIKNPNVNNALMDINVFKCSHCDNNYFTYQTS